MCRWRVSATTGHDVLADAPSDNSPDASMRIHVVGIGSVGTFVAFHLRRSLSAKHAVVAVHHRSPFKRIAARDEGGTLLVESGGNIIPQAGVEHEGLNPPRWKHVPPSILDPDAHEEEATPSPIDSLILTCKAHASLPALATLLPRISRDTTIVLLQNGMGHYDRIVSSLFPHANARPNIVLASNTHGVFSKDFLHTVHTGLGEIQLGIAPDAYGRNFEASVQRPGIPNWEQHLSLDDIVDVPPASPSLMTSSSEASDPRYLSLRNTIAALTNSPGLNASWRPLWDVQTALHRKVVVNAFINPVSALLGVRNGSMLTDAYGEFLADHVCAEAEAVFRAQWQQEIVAQRRAHQEAQAARDTPEPFRPPPYPRELEKGPLRAEITRVVELTKNNWSSMYMDIKHGRKTEIDYMTGYLIKLGRKCGLGMLTTQTLYNLLKMRERQALEEAAALKSSGERSGEVHL